MKKVVLIGSGKRAQGVILPALECLRDEFRVVGIISTTEKELNLFDGAFQMTTQTSYDSIDWSRVDVVIIAVTLDAVPSVINELSKRNTRHVTVMMDTPVLPLRKLGTLKLLKQFKQVQVSEDTLGLPPFVAARNLIDQGLIGKVKHIWLFHSGYRYHALATLKWLTQSSHIRFARMKKWNRSAGVKEILLSSGTTAVIVEPRDYSIGRFLIVGERGSIADYSLEKAENCYHIDYQIRDSAYQGLLVNGKAVLRDSDNSCYSNSYPNRAIEGLDERYRENLPRNLVETNLMTTMKIRGYMELLSNLDAPHSPYRYDPIEGLYDAGAIACLEKFGYFFDLGAFGRFLLTRLVTLASVVSVRK